MSALQAEVFEAFRAIDVPEGKALLAAAVTSALDGVQRDAERGFDKRDADLEAIRGEISALKADVSALRAEGATKAELNALGADLAALRSEAATKAELGSVKSHVQALKVDMAVMKWMLGFLLAMNVAIMFKVFAH